MIEVQQMRKFLTRGRVGVEGNRSRVGYTWLARRGRERNNTSTNNNTTTTTTTTTEMALPSREKDRDLERLIPIGASLGISDSVNGTLGSKSSSPSDSPLASSSLSHHSGKEVL